MTIIEFLETKWHVGMKVRILSGAHKGNTYNVVAPDFDQCLIGCLCNPDDNVETDIVYFRCENCKLDDMSTPEEIKKLSEAYAEYMCPVGDYCGGVYDDQRNSDLPIYKDDAKSVLKWLSKDYRIVPKKLIRKEYEEAKTMHDIYTSATCINEMESRAIDHAEGRMCELVTLFGAELFNEEKE